MTSRVLILAGAYLCLLLLGFLAAAELPHWTEADGAERGMLGAAFVAFVVFSAIPFVPGAEIGFGILMTFGASGAVAVYSGMVGGLSAAYLVGRFVPVGWLARLFRALGLSRAADMAMQSVEQSVDERAAFIARNAPARWVPFLLRNRYIALALILNMPGNVILGGGGGLAFAAGASRLFAAGPFFLTILIAVAPVPLAVYHLGH